MIEVRKIGNRMGAKTGREAWLSTSFILGLIELSRQTTDKSFLRPLFPASKGSKTIRVICTSTPDLEAKSSPTPGFSKSFPHTSKQKSVSPHSSSSEACRLLSEPPLGYCHRKPEDGLRLLGKRDISRRDAILVRRFHIFGEFHVIL